mmetsp:Transcript_7377/g.20481  ORF Transcript_7377/g.20481 Transcript_7377/m.20481 type:complete len:124 (+) Transcript_7377:103-474(+)
MKLFFSTIALLAATAVTASGKGGKKGKKASSAKLSLLHINDHHSHLVPDQDFDLEGDSVPPAIAEKFGTEEIRVEYGGLATLKTAMEAVKMEKEDEGHDVLKLHAGGASVATMLHSCFEMDCR